jgi:DTW domain-containing protein YfiP
MEFGVINFGCASDRPEGHSICESAPQSCCDSLRCSHSDVAAVLMQQSNERDHNSKCSYLISAAIADTQISQHSRNLPPVAAALQETGRSDEHSVQLRAPRQRAVFLREPHATRSDHLCEECYRSRTRKFRLPAISAVTCTA